MQGFPWWSLEHLPEPGNWTVEDIGAHLSNRTWLITKKQLGLTHAGVSQTKYLVKQFRHDQEFGRDNKRVLTIDRYVAKLGLGPRIFFVSEEQGVVIYEHLDNPLLSEVTDNDLRIQRVGQSLARIHQLTPELQQVNLRTQLEQYCVALAKYKPNDAARMREDIASYQALFDKCEEQPQVFCHNDLSMDHIFVTPELKIIDWEYAGYNHPGMDIAMAVVMNDLYEDEINCLLNEYNLHSAHSFTRDELPDWLRIVALVNRIWFKVQEAVAESATAVVSADLT
ncbi:MAG TPA: phosphotransferase [Aliidiomarina sp.]|nr:phosphotransferase [Aliidiomarina sp.]